jgi:hypothetical protein
VTKLRWSKKKERIYLAAMRWFRDEEHSVKYWSSWNGLATIPERALYRACATAKEKR